MSRGIAYLTDPGLPAIFLIGLVVVIGACTTVQPPGSTGPHEVLTSFSHDDLERVLEHVVDSDGRVDYAALSARSGDLDRYLALLARVSPDTRPGLFASEDDRLAYWINAYNASVIATVLAYYPISSVREIGPPRVAFFFPRLSGFFVFHRVILGGHRVSLYGLENRVIRRRFADPRIHFALNCGASSCPRLPRQAFKGSHLQEQLEREARKFAAEDRNVRVDVASQTIWLSSIFDWYEGDFTRSQARSGLDADLREYVRSLLSGDKELAFRACSRCRIQFLPYDWQLNDRAVAGRTA